MARKQVFHTDAQVVGVQRRASRVRNSATVALTPTPSQGEAAALKHSSR